MTKRKNGEGTWGVKKIRGIEYKFYRNADGKYFYGKTQKEIREKIKKYNPLQDLNKDIKKQYFGEYVVEWLNHVKRTEVKQRTYEGYKDSITGQLLNYTANNLSDIQVGALTTEHLRKYYLSLADNYTKGTIKKNYAVISQCIKYGNKKNHFSSQIDLSEVNIPHEDIIKKKTREIRFLTSDDMEKLYKESKRINTPGFNFGGKIGEPTYGENASLLIFIMFTGLRISEAINLSYDCVDLKSDIPTITVKDAKTPSGNRVIPLNKQALEIIYEQQNKHPNHRSTDYIFVTKNGDKIHSRQNVNRTLHKMMLRANCSISDCTPHELRHSFGSALLRNGVDVKIVSKLLGHKDITVTYNIYIHILQEQEVSAVRGLEDFF